MAFTIFIPLYPCPSVSLSSPRPQRTTTAKYTERWQLISITSALLV